MNTSFRKLFCNWQERNPAECHYEVWQDSSVVSKPMSISWMTIKITSQMKWPTLITLCLLLPYIQQTVGKYLSNVVLSVRGDVLILSIIFMKNILPVASEKQANTSLNRLLLLTVCSHIPTIPMEFSTTLVNVQMFLYSY